MNLESDHTASPPKAQPIKLTIAVILLCIAGTGFYLGTAYREEIENLFSDEKINTTQLYDPDSNYAVTIIRREEKGQENSVAEFSIQLTRDNQNLMAGGLLLRAPASLKTDWTAKWRSPEVVLYLNDEPFVDGIAEEGRQIWIKTYGLPEGFQETEIPPDDEQ